MNEIKFPCTIFIYFSKQDSIRYSKVELINGKISPSIPAREVTANLEKKEEILSDLIKTQVSSMTATAFNNFQPDHVLTNSLFYYMFGAFDQFHLFKKITQTASLLFFSFI